MNNKANGHTGDFIKRQAKKIKKQENISHVQALDKASMNAGFKNWRHFHNTLKDVSLSYPKENFERGITQTQATSAQKAFSPYRNLLISAINSLLDKHLISLNGQSSDNEDGHVFVDLFGYPSVIIWRSISYDELEISVWWKYNHKLHPQAKLSGNSHESFNNSTPLADKAHYKKFVGAVVIGWFERRMGKYLMGKNNEAILRKYIRRGEKEALENLPIQKPKGFRAEGKFYF